MDFYEIFTKLFRVYSIFKKGKTDADRWNNQMLHFLRKLLPKLTSDLKNSPGYVLWLKKLKNGIEISLKATGVELQANHIKICHALYICEKNEAQ